MPDRRAISSPINARKGGRPIGTETLAAQEMRRVFIRRVQRKANAYMDAWEDLALGHFVEVPLPNGTTRVYKKSPNGMVLQNIFEHIWGKATQPIAIVEEATVNFGSEAIKRMEKYVEATDAEYKIITDQVREASIDWSHFKVRSVGVRSSGDQTEGTGEVDPHDIEEEE